MDDTDDLNHILQDEEEDDENNLQLSPAELLEMMEEVWINEKFSPEIQPNKSDIVECVLGQISYMQENLDSLPAGDFKKSIHQLEVERIRFLVTSYLRHRLEKIENYVVYILKQEEERMEKGEETYLTEAELKFAKEYKEAFEQHVRNVTRSYPNLPIQNWRNHALIAPNLNSFVFVKAKTAVEGILIDTQRRDESDVVDLIPNSQVIISYNSIANLLQSSSVKLI